MRKFLKKTTKYTLFTFGLITLFIARLFGQSDHGEVKMSQKTDDILEGAFGGVRAAQADTGHKSLLVEYWNGATYKTIDVYSPRYYQPTVNAFRLPKDAVAENGEVRMRVKATKRHKVNYVGFISPEQLNDAHKTNTYPPTKAVIRRTQEDHHKVLAKQRSGEYMHTVPADVVDVTFDVADNSTGTNTKDTYLVQAGGIYTGLSKKAKAEAGDWVAKLDPESRSFLESLYVLRNYRDTDRQPFVTKKS